jgi:hypothetical protein
MLQYGDFPQLGRATRHHITSLSFSWFAVFSRSRSPGHDDLSMGDAVDWWITHLVGSRS